MNDIIERAGEAREDGRAHLAEAERRAALPAADETGRARTVGLVGVVGAGTMGVGIALAFAYAGIPVRIFDADGGALVRGLARAEADIEGRAAKGRLTPEAAAAARMRLATVPTLEGLRQADMVVEAVFENLDLKRQVFAALDGVCRPGCVLATNTSTLDVDRIAAATRRPQDVVGLHFFSPAHVMRLLEIVRGAETSPDALATARAVGAVLGKIAVVVGNCYGFAGNRMIEGLSREANRMLLEGAAVRRVDEAMTSWGMAMGPFAVADVVGIDVPYRARRETPQAAPGDDAYYLVADRLVEMDRLGQKSGRGYYLYPDGPRRPVDDPEVAQLAQTEARRLGIEVRAHTPDDIVARCVMPLILEGARILEEGIAARPSDLDLIYVHGYGFPAARGGPMAYADAIGLPQVVDTLARLRAASQHDYWAASPLLERLAREGRPLASLNGDDNGR